MPPTRVFIKLILGLFTQLEIKQKYVSAIKSTLLHCVMHQFNITIEDTDEHNDNKLR